MEPIEGNFQVVKLAENQYDVLFFAEEKILKAFSKTYPESIFIENSKFGKPLIAIPNFETKNLVNLFINYWIEAFQNPDKACKTCPTVNEFLTAVEKSRQPL